MAVPIMNKIFVIFLAVSFSVVASSNAVQRARARFVINFDPQEQQAPYEEIPTKISHDDEFQDATLNRAHERMLKMNNHDYGSYDPTPALSKPKSKLIPN